jgi:geranylgeranyl reductase family protein
VEYDLIVCGGGPAGAMAAATAARAGQKVLLLEKERLPRYKTCGGGMPMVVGDYLRDLAPSAFVEAQVRTMRHTWEFERPYLAEINPPGTEPDITLWMVQRSVFDCALVQHAASQGAEVRDELAVRAIEVDRTGVTVRAAHGGNESALLARGRHLVGADGATGMAAKASGLRKERRVAVAVEVEVPHTWGDGHPDLRPEVMHLEYGAVSRGYAWVFPKGDHLSVGAGVFQPERESGERVAGLGARLKEVVFRYLEALQIPYTREAIRFHAHPIPLWSRKEPLQTRNGRILLAGDAAGLVNPLFGDGILHAVRSGTLAAECLVEGVPTQYTRRVQEQVISSFSGAARLAGLTYDWAHVLYDRGICRPRATHMAACILAGLPLSPALMGYLLSRFRGALREARLPAG